MRFFAYYSRDFRILFVDIGAGSRWSTFSVVVVGGSRKVVKTGQLPPRETKEEAQKDLDAYAKKYRLGLVE